MKLDINCVRDLMLYIESDIQDFSQYSDISEMKEKLDHDEKAIVYTCQKLIEAGYITGIVELSDLSESYICQVHSITFSGHEYLDKIRNKTIFDRVEKAVEENGGSVSFQLFGSLCEKALDILLNKYLG